MPPKVNYEALYIGGVFIKFQNFKKSPYRKLSGDGSVSHRQRMFKLRSVDKLVEAQLVEQEPKLVEWARFPFGSYRRLDIR